jgi:hypothetical protein
MNCHKNLFIFLFLKIFTLSQSLVNFKENEQKCIDFCIFKFYFLFLSEVSFKVIEFKSFEIVTEIVFNP